MKHYAIFTGSLLVYAIAAQAQAASISTTSGSLTAFAQAPSSQTVIAGPGNYSVSDSRNVMVFDDLTNSYKTVTVTSSASSSITGSAININATASGTYDPWNYISATTYANGSINFFLSSASNAIFNFSGSINPLGSNSSATLYGPDGALILQCSNPAGTDCFGPGWNGGLNGGYLTSPLLLSAGNYNMTFVTSSDLVISSMYNGYLDVSLELQPVPVPAAAWLFATGLIGLIGFAKRRAV